MLFADAPDATALGQVIQIFFYIAGGLGGIMLAIASLMNMLKKTPPALPSPDSEFVTRGELDRHLERISNAIESRFRAVESDVETLRIYTQDRTHDLSNKIHAINLRIVYATTLLSQVCAKMGIDIPPMPAIDTKDEA